MPITHAAIKVSGEIGTAAEWNADHNITSDLLSKKAVTLVVAASDSLNTSQADYQCDGVQDQVEINQAITDLPANGGRILLLEGTFIIGAQISINKNYVTLEGNGHASVITLSNGANCSCITFSQPHVAIKNLKINGNKAFQAGVSYGVVGGSNYIRIKEVYIINYKGTGIWLNDVEYTHISGCILDGTEAIGIRLDNNARHSLIDGCLIKSSGTHSISIGGGANAFGNTVSNNIINDSGGIGIHIDHNNKSCVVSNNRIINPGQAGICVVGASSTVVTGNTIRLSHEEGVRLTTASIRNVVAANIVEYSTSDGIKIDDDTDKNIVASNSSAANTGFGVNILNANCDWNLVHGNWLRDNTAGALQDNGTNTTSVDNVV